MTLAALGLYVAFLAAALGWRTWLQYRRTGDHGFRGLSGKIGSLEWWGGVLLALGMALGLISLVAQFTDIIQPIRMLERPPIRTAGLVMLLAGFAVTIAAQLQMRDSWRIGVDEREKTGLVKDGLFAFVRNPIFTGMLLVSAGTLLLAPNLLSILAFAGALSGLEIQVRRVEEPYLARAHGGSYLAYARKVGRFVPWVGRWRG